MYKLHQEYCSQGLIFTTQDLNVFHELIKQTESGRFNISISGRKGRIIGSLIELHHEGGLKQIEEFSCKAEDSKKEMSSIMERMYRHLIDKQSIENSKTIGGNE